MFQFKPSMASATGVGTTIVAMINSKAQDTSRIDYFDDPVIQLLNTSELGGVTRCQSIKGAAPDGIAFCEIEMFLIDPVEDAVRAVVTELEKMGAPKGSMMIDPTGLRPDTRFGKAEGMAIYFNDPKFDPIDLIDALEAQLDSGGADGAYVDHWTGTTGRALYFYGLSYDQMVATMRPVLKGAPTHSLSRIA